MERLENYLKSILLLTLLMLSHILYSQTCDYTYIWELPFEEEWCFYDDTECIANPAGILDPINGCWNCINENVHWYLFTPVEDAVVTINVLSDVFSTNPFTNANQVIYYAVFDNCPWDGGRVISYPCNCNNENSPCWEFQEDIIIYSCWYNANGNDWTVGSNGPCFIDAINNGYPTWNYPTHQFVLELELTGGEEYWIAVYPSDNTDDTHNPYGCISVLIDGPSLLGIEPVEPEQEYVDEEENEDDYRVRKIVHPNYGFLIIYPNGKIYDSTFRELNIKL